MHYSCSKLIVLIKYLKIRWTDGQLYNGYFRRAYEATTYYVMFIGEDAEVPMSREEIRMKNESAEGVATTS